MTKFRAEGIIKTPHFILSDLKFQDGGRGIDAIALIRRELGQAVPAAILVTQTSQDNLREIIAAGLELLSKPPEQNRLIALLEKHNPHGAADLEPDLNGMVVLLVDDDQDPRKALKERLIEWGCYVIDGDSAEDVVNKCLAEDVRSPNFIVSDFRLPNGKTGIEAIALIRKKLGQSVPAAIWSAETSQAKLRDIAAAGLEMFAKPPEERPLIELLKKYSENAAAASLNKGDELQLRA
jgi:CheY-like chemotaxis protein